MPDDPGIDPERMERILLTEDNQDNADLVCALLEDSYEIKVAATATEALDYLEALPDDEYPSLFLLDISLPGMDGIELLRRLRADARFKSIPAVAVTAHAMKDDRNRLLAVGFEDYLSKPLDGDELVESVQRWISSSP